MKDLTPIVSHNLTELRKARGLTQGQLAEKFSYSDKSISKWEHGGALPDLGTLQELADYYGVTLDYLTHEESDASLSDYGTHDPEKERVNRIVIVCLGVTFIWTIVACAIVGCKLFDTAWPYWMPILWMLPATFLFLGIINHSWGHREWSLPLQITFIWTFVISAYIEVGMDIPEQAGWKLWVILLVGVPITIAQILFQRTRRR
jgi:transcriptional regulator with XRE-family HTH domain